jgi:lysozyme family protein
MSVKTYDEAMRHVYEYEGGYSNDAGDSGGPTKYGITIHDARMYWKANATSNDVRNMPKSVAADIYAKHYALPLHYNELPAGVDFAVLDYGINSGISRAAKVLQRIVGATPDGQIGPITLAATHRMDAHEIINQLCDERMRFLRGLGIFRIFGKGWTTRVKDVRATALHMAD